MFRLKYTGPFQGDYWEFPTYYEIVRVKNGECEVQYPDTVTTLEMHGFVKITEDVSPPSLVTPTEPSPKLEPESQRERKVIEMYRDGGASVSMISKSLRMGRKTVIKILEKYKDYLSVEEVN